MKKFLVALLALFLFTSFNHPPKKLWIAIGDSITYLNEHADETGNRVKKGYLTRVVEKAPRLSYVNQGHNGWTAAGIAERIDSLGITTADVYTVLLGTNDWWAGRPIGTISDYSGHTGTGTLYGSFRIIIDKLRKLNSQAKIILITPMKRTDFVYLADFTNNAYGCYKPKNGQWLHEFAAAIDSIGLYEKIPVIDLYNDDSLVMERLVKFKRLRKPGGTDYVNFSYPQYTSVAFDPLRDEHPYPTEAIDFTYDGLHPSDAGNEIIAQRLLACFRKLRLVK